MVKLTIQIADFTQSFEIQIPTAPVKCTLPQVYNPITGKCETPITICTPPQIYNPVTGRCETPTPPSCTPPQIYNPVTGRCETPTPPPPPIAVCNIGDVRKIKCPDGSDIVTESCQIDPITGFNRWVPTGNTCPLPELGKQIKILAYPEGVPLQAYEGQEVTITAAVSCGLSPSNGEAAIFIVDGKEVSNGTTSQGFVSFKWTAITDPSRTHKICISIPKSDQCVKYGEARDCKTITVSRIVPGIEEQLKRERETYQEQLELLRLERERIRQLPEIPIPSMPTYPGSFPPIPTPSGPLPPIPTTPVPPTTPQTGIISIPSVRVPPGIEFPITIYIDGQLVDPPPVYRQVSAGTHILSIQLKGFSPISLKVDVPAGGIKTIEESFI